MKIKRYSQFINENAKTGDELIGSSAKIIGGDDEYLIDKIGVITGHSNGKYSVELELSQGEGITSTTHKDFLLNELEIEDESPWMKI